jgi:hypothetical protein
MHVEEFNHEMAKPNKYCSGLAHTMPIRDLDW